MDAGKVEKNNWAQPVLIGMAVTGFSVLCISMLALGIIASINSYIALMIDGGCLVGGALMFGGSIFGVFGGGMLREIGKVSAEEDKHSVSRNLKLQNEAGNKNITDNDL